MSDNQPEAEEPSIEEILASIRQIISDDDEEGVEAAEEEVAEESTPSVEAEPEDDVLELTDELKDEMEIDFIDTEEEEESVFVAEEDVDVYEPPAQEARSFDPTPSSILSDSAQSATMSSLSKLVGNVPLNRRGYDGITLEDIVRELLNPMLRDWMDDNLPPMVERIVQKELEKLARRAMDE
ncbi:MAG: hypothetical protein CMH31_06580 [Micavibrio sp.]|nr:hypothetical protein [Micavibrio sp.]|tara:strand:+ start:373 stop:918 length:546 start_codon:yes stop_codon:yes gene_type:complete